VARSDGGIPGADGTSHRTSGGRTTRLGSAEHALCWASLYRSKETAEHKESLISICVLQPSDDLQDLVALARRFSVEYEARHDEFFRRSIESIYAAASNRADLALYDAHGVAALCVAPVGRATDSPSGPAALVRRTDLQRSRDP